MTKSLLQRAARSCGYEIRRIQPAPAGRDWISDVLRLMPPGPERVFFDIGANVGDVSLRLAAAYPHPARIFAFEPAAATFRQLTAAVAAHRQVQCRPLAFAEKAGHQPLFHGINSQLNRLAPTGALGDGGSEEIEVDTVDAFARREGLDRVDLLKTDTEGFDSAVLQGAAGLLGRQAIAAVVSEVTFDTASDWHTTFDAVRARLAPHGFYLHGIYDCELWGTHLKYANVLFLQEHAFPLSAS